VIKERSDLYKDLFSKKDILSRRDVPQAHFYYSNIKNGGFYNSYMQIQMQGRLI